MNHIKYNHFCDMIAKDYNIDPQYKSIYPFNSFPIINGKRKINARFESIIVDNNGNEFPYMLEKTIRNEEKLITFDHIYTIRSKPLETIIKEIGLNLKNESCKICEGGGWYSKGTRYFYKDVYCEI